MCPVDVAPTACHADPSLTDASLREELIIELDESSVPWELLTSWSSMEAKELRILSAVQSSKTTSITSEVREAALRFLHALAETLGLKQNGWLDCVLLFDRYCISNGGNLCSAECLPELCVAIATIVKKNDSNSSINVVDLSKLATQYAHWLAGMGFTKGARSIDKEDVASQEKIVLTALDWSVTIPSVHSWMGLLCKRFDILTRGMSSAALDWIYSQSITSAGMLVLHQIAFSGMTPREMANGLFCTFLSAAAIVPAEAFRPSKLTQRQWEELLSESQCQGAQPSSVGRAASVSLLSLLQVVAGRALPGLQADTHAVVLAMRDIAVGLRAPGRHCAPQKATTHHGTMRSSCVGVAQGAGLHCGRL